MLREDRVGYVIGNDQYFKRDDVGCIFQINVLPEYRRHLVAAALLKAMFERSAYGCKLYCCWCAQDIEANRFWESMGFTAIAFRTGSAKASGRRVQESADGEGASSSSLNPEPRTLTARIHIFWQRRIRSGDMSTPFWYPSKTDGGSLGAQRLVLPIPPGTHWSDAKPVILPGMEAMREGESFTMSALPGPEKAERESGRAHV